MEREFTIETVTSSKNETTYTLRVWCKSYDGAENRIEASVYAMNEYEMTELRSLVANTV